MNTFESLKKWRFTQQNGAFQFLKACACSAMATTVIPRAFAANAVSSNPQSNSPLVIAPNQLSIVFGILALMALLFTILFYWQGKNEGSLFLVGIFKESVRRMERSRLTEPIMQKWTKGDYIDEVLLLTTARARKWSAEGAENKLPVPSSDLKQLAKDNPYELEMMGRDVRWRLRDAAEGVGGTSRKPTSAPPGLGGLRGASKQSESEASDLATGRTYGDLLQKYAHDLDVWVQRAAGRIREWLEEDLAKMDEEAEKQAGLAMNVDFSALKGRGPEFVLEFTAIVVVIFTALLLGVLDVLHEQEIGTLLAAIAGYVLGRGKSSRQVQEDKGAAPVPQKT